MDQELMASLGVSLAIGLLVGLERQRAIAAKEGRATLIGGVRTFPLVALCGSACALLGRGAGVWLEATALVALVALMAAHRLGLPADDREPGLTTEMAAVFTFLLGALVVSESAIAEFGHRLLTCASLAVVATLLLSVKPRLHAAVRRISDADIFATVQLLVVAVVALPLLPNRAFGPFLAINPQTIGRMILFVGAVSFVGYAASRMFGAQRGLAVSGLIGGLVSSTAVTFSVSRRVKAEPAVLRSGAVAVVAASSMMLVRVVIAVVVVYAPLALSLLLPMGLMLAVGAVALFVLWRRAKSPTGGNNDAAKGDVELQNPFELKSAVVFGLLFAFVTFAARAVRATLGDQLLVLAGVVAGTTDVDAITLSTSGLAAEGLSPSIASTTILVACFSNTVVKAGIALVTGGAKFGARIALVFGAMGLAGGIGLAAQWLIASSTSG